MTAASSLGIVPRGQLNWTVDRETAMREYNKAYRRSGRGREGQRARDLLRRYGITEADYDQMRADQGNRCAVCLTHEDELPRSRSGRPRADGSPPTPAPPLVVDHCHTTGKVRGLLCPPCNAGLGSFADDLARLLGAAQYLIQGGAS